MLHHSNTQKVYDHWRRASQRAHPPNRSDIHPASIAKALGSTVLIHKSGDGSYRFQLAGSRLCAAMGRELAGERVKTIIDPADHKTMMQGLAAVEQEHAVFVAGLSGYSKSGEYAEFEAVFMPLQDAETMILGAIEPKSIPVWLGSHAIIAMELNEIRMVDLGRELFSLQNRPAIRLPRRPMPEAPVPAPGEEKQLSVIAGQGTGQSRQKTVSLRVYEGGKT